MRVVSTSPLPIDLAAQLPNARVEIPEQWIGVERCDLSDADALVCLLLDRIDAAVLARAPKLRVIANCAVGYDNVDVAAATRAGIAVTNTPGVLTEATAEFTIALMLAAARRLPEGERLVRSGAWPGWRLDQLLGVELAGKTIGIVGPGRIGQAVARRASALGMDVLYIDRMNVHSAEDPEAIVEGFSLDNLESAQRMNVHSSSPAAHPEWREATSVDELFATADVISLHCPLTDATRHLVNAARLSRAKPTAIVVNTARGGCVDERALAEALVHGRIFAAALDVFAHEPAIDPALLAAPRVVLAPHLGSATTEARTQMAHLCADAVIAVLAGGRPANLVEPSVVVRG